MSCRVYGKASKFRSSPFLVFLRGQPPWLVYMYFEGEGRGTVLEDI